MEGCGLTRAQKCDSRLASLGDVFALFLGQVVEIFRHFLYPSEDGVTNEGAHMCCFAKGPMECEREEGGEGVVEGDFPRKFRNVEVDAAPGDVNRDSFFHG